MPILAGLDRGVAVFAEKPLAWTLAEADAIAARLAADDRSRLQVGYMKLYDPAVVEALEVADDTGRVGADPVDRGPRPPPDERAAARPRAPAAATGRHPGGDARPPSRRGRTAAIGRRRTGRGDPRSPVLEHRPRQHRPRAGTHPRLRRRPGRHRRRRRLAGRASGRRRSRSMASSPVGPGSRSAGTSCPTTPRTARRSASSPSSRRSSSSFPPRISSTPRPICAWPSWPAMPARTRASDPSPRRSRRSCSPSTGWSWTARPRRRASSRAGRTS